MKKIIIVVFVTVVLITKIWTKEFHIGVKSGLNISNTISENEFFDFKSKMGIIFGGYVFIPLGNSIAIQPELLYTMKGAKYEVEGLKVVHKLSYLEIPTLLKLVSAKINKGIKPSLFFGPAVSMLLSAKAEIDYPKDLEDLGLNDETEDIKKYRKSFDIGIVVGGGIDFNSGLMFDIRYNKGLTEIGATESFIDMKNNVFSFMIGYNFH